MIEIKSNLSRKKLLDRVFTIALIILFIVVIVMTYSLSEVAGSVPRLISIFGIVLSIISLISEMIKDNKESKNDKKIKIDNKKEASEAAAESDNNQGLPFVKSFGLIVLYLIAMVVLGFIISTLLMLTFMPRFLNYKKWKTNIIFAVLTTAVFYISFSYFLNVQLPVGLLFELFL